MGRVTPGQTQKTPVLGNLEASSPNAGELSITFKPFKFPDNKTDYLIQVIASYHESTTTVKSQPAVRFLKFTEKGFVYKVTRSNKDLSVDELGTMEFQVNVSIIETQ